MGEVDWETLRRNAIAASAGWATTMAEILPQAFGKWDLDRGTNS
jgi:hypothetical protein